MINAIAAKKICLFTNFDYNTNNAVAAFLTVCFSITVIIHHSLLTICFLHISWRLPSSSSCEEMHIFALTTDNHGFSDIFLSFKMLLGHSGYIFLCHASFFCMRILCHLAPQSFLSGYNYSVHFTNY